MSIFDYRKLSLAILVGSGVVVCGCDQGKPLTHEVEVSGKGLPDGWTRAEDKASGLSMGVAPNWQAVNLGANVLKAGANEIAKDNPSEKGDMKDVKKVAGTDLIKLFVAHAAVNGVNFSPNINVIEEPAPPGETPDQVVKANLQDLSGSYQNVAQQPNEHLAMGDAYVITAKQSLKSQGANLLLDSAFYIVFSGSQMILLTVTIPAGSKLMPEADAMAKTLSLGK